MCWENQKDPPGKPGAEAGETGKPQKGFGLYAQERWKLLKGFKQWADNQIYVLKRSF